MFQRSNIVCDGKVIQQRPLPGIPVAGSKIKVGGQVYKITEVLFDMDYNNQQVVTVEPEDAGKKAAESSDAKPGGRDRSSSEKS